MPGAIEYILRVRATSIALMAGLLLFGGCAGKPPAARSVDECEMFAPVSMRIHPIFTQVKDWTGDGQVDGVEALVEFQDQFGDPTKAAGVLTFELFIYRMNTPDGRGERVVNPWQGSLQTLGEQHARWNRTSRTYAFQLEYPQVRQSVSYVLAAQFDNGRTRYFDQTIIEGERHGREAHPTTHPSTRPSHATTAP